MNSDEKRLQIFYYFCSKMTVFQFEMNKHFRNVLIVGFPCSTEVIFLCKTVLELNLDVKT